MNRRGFLTKGLARLISAPELTPLPVGFIFVGASWCPVCKHAAPVLALFAERHQIPVLVASHDGRPIAPFRSVTDARTHPLSQNIATLPTTLVYAQASDQVIAQLVGYRDPTRFARSLARGVEAALEVSRHA